MPVVLLQIQLMEVLKKNRTLLVAPSGLALQLYFLTTRQQVPRSPSVSRKLRVASHSATLLTEEIYLQQQARSDRSQMFSPQPHSTNIHDPQAPKFEPTLK